MNIREITAQNLHVSHAQPSSQFGSLPARVPMHRASRQFESILHVTWTALASMEFTEQHGIGDQPQSGSPLSTAFGPFPVATVPMNESAPPAPRLYCDTVLSLKFATHKAYRRASTVMYKAASGRYCANGNERTAGSNLIFRHRLPPWLAA